MGFWDIFDGGGDDEDAGPYPELQEKENTEIARIIAESDLGDWKDLLLDYRFLYYHWPEIKETINSNEELRELYGCNNENIIYMEDGCYMCSEHDVRLETKTYGDEVRTETTNQTGASAKTSGLSGLNIGVDKSKRRRETRINPSGEIDVCKVKPSNCTVSLYYFYQEASHSRPVGRRQSADDILITDDESDENDDDESDENGEPDNSDTGE